MIFGSDYLEYIQILQTFEMYEIIAFSIISLTLFILLFTTLVNISFGPYLRKAAQLNDFPKVSLLVPARNEEKNIRRLIESLLNMDYPNYEIIILDDNSTDDTYKICETYLSFPNFKLIRGGELLDGWLGKNNACRQLAENATGDYLIFTDADNFHENFAVRNTISLMNKYNLGMLSAFPEQKTETFFEKLIIPVIDLIVYSGLVLWSTLFIPLKIFAAANGQWIAFTREAYKQIGGHAAVRNHIVEDVALSREAKSKGIKVLTTAGTGAVYGKMYSSFKEIWFGLSKNIYGLTDFKPLPFFILLTMIFVCGILPYILLFSGKYFIIAFILVLINSIWRVLLSIGFKHNFFISVLLHPISLIMLISIGINSFIKSTFGELTWKDRSIRISSK